MIIRVRRKRIVKINELIEVTCKSSKCVVLNGIFFCFLKKVSFPYIMPLTALGVWVCNPWPNQVLLPLWQQLRDHFFVCTVEVLLSMPCVYLVMCLTLSSDGELHESMDYVLFIIFNLLLQAQCQLHKNCAINVIESMVISQSLNTFKHLCTVWFVLGNLSLFVWCFVKFFHHLLCVWALVPSCFVTGQQGHNGPFF